MCGEYEMLNRQTPEIGGSVVQTIEVVQIAQVRTKYVLH